MATAPHYSANGDKLGEITLDANVFGEAMNRVLLLQAVVAQQANARVALAHTKTRGDVSGGGKKPWRQKGTGRARHGSIRSPIWRGGGTTFGPRSDRNFSKKLPVKARRKAIRIALSDKASAQALAVLDAPPLARPRTKDLVALVKKLSVKTPTLLVLPERNDTLIRSAKNSPLVTPIAATSLNVVDILKHRSLIAVTGAVEKIQQTFA
ncbi:MAG: 50S ribosomal protein L4 [Candidatus Kerfeldbacteria bacterium]|nr:50S ribosomal protein L4 [Candidatus Kerfeldbacteria bacterium]